MVKIKTFDFPARVGAVGEFEPVVRSVQFGDGYRQSIGEGLNALREQWPLSFVGVWSDIEPIVDFLREHQGWRAFKWRNPLSELGLYQAGKFSLQANNTYFTLSVTLNRIYHPYYLHTEKRISR
ncbi:phage tail protein [Xenorhabdus griffiniae]|uniref:phage tail protein n=1 Tax=Xenorhabdus griffiniae TaxID=351672 RepID=UPI00235810AB|nr:phage tail protein [Xenorhabdus griffiniae]MDC9606635.1 phage tail protein [Xenorhabdus griffiniae]